MLEVWVRHRYRSAQAGPKNPTLVDHAVGFIVHHKVGDKVEQGEPLFAIHANDEKKQVEAREKRACGACFQRYACAGAPAFL